MNSLTGIPEVACGIDFDAGQASLPHGNDGMRRIVWHMRDGDILIEVDGDAVWVNRSVCQAETPLNFHSAKDLLSSSGVIEPPVCDILEPAVTRLKGTIEGFKLERFLPC